MQNDTKNVRTSFGRKAYIKENKVEHNTSKQETQNEKVKNSIVFRAVKTGTGQQVRSNFIRVNFKAVEKKNIYREINRFLMQR